MPGSELIGEEERRAVNEIFDSGAMLYRYGLDDSKVQAFEQEFAKKVGAKYAYAVSSGTAALKAALIGMGIKPGDEVITQSHTFVATVEAIVETGATPVITEVNETLNMDPSDLERKITRKTKAVIPVHMAGVPAQMKEILTIAKGNDLFVLEDSAQAAGATYFGKHTGTLGDAAIFSFDYGKMITTGEGGMVVTNSREIYQKVREYSDHGHEMNPKFPRGRDTRTRGGFNFRMMEIPGAIGLAQLEKLEYGIACQRANKKRMKDAITDLPGISFRAIPDTAGEIADTLIFFVKDPQTAGRFAAGLQKRGIPTKNLPDAITWHFAGTWTHILPAFKRYRDKNLMKLWPESTGLIERAIAIAVNIRMSDQELDERIAAITDISRSG
jgi:8-amino-3,8-dideoxy-alpha-D-manno-octulosonate transaminase